MPRFFGKWSSQGLGLQQTHTVRAAAAVLGIQKLFNTYYYSSTFEYPQIGVYPTYDISYADPIVLPLLSTEYTQFRPVGTNLSRLDKVTLVAEFEESYSFLDVCVDDPASRLESEKPNCSTCWKCGRQIFTLKLLGRENRYSDVFDFGLFDQDIEKILHKLAMDGLSGDHPNELDPLALAQEKKLLWGVDLNLLVRLSSKSWKIKRFLAKMIAKKIASGM